jgi:hypothetical protein
MARNYALKAPPNTREFAKIRAVHRCQERIRREFCPN